MYKKPGAYLTGTASIANGGITVTGVGTLITSELNNGSYVNLENVVFKVVTIANNTSMSVTPVSDVAVSAKAIRIHSTPGWMMPEYAKHVKYYFNFMIDRIKINSSFIIFRTAFFLICACNTNLFKKLPVKIKTIGCQNNIRP